MHPNDGVAGVQGHNQKAFRPRPSIRKQRGETVGRLVDPDTLRGSRRRRDISPEIIPNKQDPANGFLFRKSLRYRVHGTSAK